MSRDKKILIILVSVWIGILAYYMGIFGGTEVAPVKKRARVAAVLNEVPELRLDLLDRPKAAYKGIKKNIFSPLKVRKPKPPKIEPVEKPLPLPEPEKPVVKPPPSPLQVFMSRVRFIGFVEKGKERTVFLNRGEDVFLVKAGDLIDSRFRVAEITDTMLRLSDELSGEAAVLGLETE